MDNFADIYSVGQAVAIFECNTVFFGLIPFKPKELFIFTSKGLRIVANEKLKFNIPMEHVEDVHVEFLSTAISIIAISVTTQYAAQIESSIERAHEVELSPEERGFTEARITLLCEKLPKLTKTVLRSLFPRIYDIELSKAETIIQTLNESKMKSTKKQNQTIDPLIRPKSPTVSKENNDKNFSLNRLQSESVQHDKRQATCTDESHSLKQPAVPESSALLENADFSSAEEAQTILSDLSDVDEHSATENENTTILLYQHYEGAISLSIGDYKCLASREYLNDKIIDFYLKYIENNVISSKRDRKRTHIFSSYFYHVLTFKDRRNKTDNVSNAQRRHDRVKNWTKNVNIFEKDFIFVPVMERLHWFLIVICFPSILVPVNNNTFHKKEEKANEIVKQPLILIFNSIADTTNYRATMILREYLTYEFKAKMPHNAEMPSFTKETMPGHRVKVPQQNNLHDCGLYVLQYVEEFFKQPIRDFRIPINAAADWFDSKVIVRKREEIAKTIQNLSDEQYKAIGTCPNFKFPNIRFPTLNGKLVKKVRKRMRRVVEPAEEL